MAIAPAPQPRLPRGVRSSLKTSESRLPPVATSRPAEAPIGAGHFQTSSHGRDRGVASPGRTASDSRGAEGSTERRTSSPGLFSSLAAAHLAHGWSLADRRRALGLTDEDIDELLEEEQGAQ